MKFSLSAIFVIFIFLFFEGRASRVYANLAFGLCAVNDFQDSIQKISTKTQDAALEKILNVCAILNSSLLNLERGFSCKNIIINDLNGWYEELVRNNGSYESEQSLSLDQTFKIFIAGLPSIVGTKLFQTERMEDSGELHQLVYNDHDLKKYTQKHHDSLPKYLTIDRPGRLFGGSHSSEQIVELQSQQFSKNEGQSHPYMLAMIFAKTSNGFSSIFPVRRKNSIFHWKVLSMEEKSLDKAAFLSVQTVSDDDLCSLLSDERALFFYRHHKAF